MKKFEWTEEMNQVLRERFTTDGPKKLSEELNVPYWTLMSQTYRLKLTRTRGTPHKVNWTDEMLQALRERYPSEGGDKLAEEFGFLARSVHDKAKELQIPNTSRGKRSGDSRAIRNTSCNIHYFDTWSPNMAYILGFLFADGSVDKSHHMVVVNLAEKDKCVLEFIKKELQAKYPIRFIPAVDINGPQSNFNLSSKILAEKLIELGMKPRKTYNDDPFPEVPDEMMPHFIRGYFDGDGTASISNIDTLYVGFCGSVKLITGIRDALVRLLGMRTSPVSEKKGLEAVLASTGWYAVEDIKLFHQFVYPEGYGFCLQRKKDKIDKWLSKDRYSRGQDPRNSSIYRDQQNNREGVS